MSNIHEGHRNRLRKKAFEYGLECLQPHEVLELALSFSVPYKDMNPIAHELLNKFGSIREVLSEPKEELQKITGIAKKSAEYLNFLILFHDYLARIEIQDERPVLNSAQKVAEFCESLMSNLKQEEFYVICLENNSKVKHYKRFAKGTTDAMLFNLQEVINYINNMNCKNVVISHNHPNGLAKPSLEDIKTTRQLYMALSFHGVLLIDHIIIAEKGSYYSFLRNHIMDEWKESVERMFQPHMHDAFGKLS